MTNYRRVIEGQVVAVAKFLYTWGLLLDVTEESYSGRYCYASFDDAMFAMENWDGTGDPPGPWIKYKGAGGERLGPGATEGI